MTGWLENARADNAASTATKAAATGKQHVLYSVHAAFSAAATKTLLIKDGTTTIATADVVNTATVTFPKGIGVTLGNALVVELAASGTGGVFGSVTMHGDTF